MEEEWEGLVECGRCIKMVWKRRSGDKHEILIMTHFWKKEVSVWMSNGFLRRSLASKYVSISDALFGSYNKVCRITYSDF